MCGKCWHMQQGMKLERLASQFSIMKNSHAIPQCRRFNHRDRSVGGGVLSAYTKNLSEYIKKRGINLSKVARETGISYSALYSSLMDSGRERDLNAGTVMYLHHFSELELSSI